MTTTTTLAASDFFQKSGTDLLTIVKAGKRNPAFFLACDEIDRRVTQRVAAGKAITQPVAEALAILDKRRIAHAGPAAKDVTVLGQREKVTVTVTDAIVGLPVEITVAPVKARKAPKAKPAKKVDPMVALRKAAREQAEIAAANMMAYNGKGFVYNKIQAEKVLLAAIG